MSSIGDIVIVSPIVRSLRNRYPDAEIHFLVKKKFFSLVEHSPYLKKIYAFEKSIYEILPLLRKERYDFIIDLHKNWRSLLLRLYLFKRAYCFRKLNFRKWLFVLTKRNMMPREHLVHRMFRGLRKLEIFYDGQGLEYFFPSQKIVLPAPIEKFIHVHNAFYAFCIGGTYYTKRCPNHKAIEIINTFGRPVVLLGGKEDQENANEIMLHAQVPVISACGQATIDGSACIMQKARLVVSNDTGMMHIAAALRKPIISLWGNTVPEFGMYPLLPDDFQIQPFISQVTGLSCRPCSKLGYHHCPKKHFRCMNELDVSQMKRYFAQYFSV